MFINFGFIAYMGMSEQHTSLPDGVVETTLVTVPKKPLFKKGKKDKVTKIKKHEQQFRCPNCLRVAKKLSMRTCLACKEAGLSIIDFCKVCVRKHDIVGSPYTHKAKWGVTYPEEVFQL